MLLNSKLDKLVLGKCLRQSLFKRYYIIINNKTYKTLIKTLTPICVCSNHTIPTKIRSASAVAEFFLYKTTPQPNLATGQLEILLLISFFSLGISSFQKDNDEKCQYGYCGCCQKCPNIQKQGSFNSRSHYKTKNKKIQNICECAVSRKVQDNHDNYPTHYPLGKIDHFVVEVVCQSTHIGSDKEADDQDANPNHQFAIFHVDSPSFVKCVAFSPSIKLYHIFVIM